jgi:hypothetical protein
MSERYPRIRVHAENGALLVREGLSLSFYMRRNHREVAPLVQRSLETYLRAVGSEALGWYADQEGFAQPLDERGWTLIRRELLEDDFPIIQLMDASQDERYLFEYWGKDLEDSSLKEQSTAVCAALFWLPTEFLEEHGPGRVRELAIELAAPLPLCSGQGGLSFNAAFDLAGVRAQVARHWFRYPGLDILGSFGTYSWELGTRVRGAQWLTFLGQPVLGQLGGAAGLRERLRNPATTVQEMEADKVLVTLGPRPETGDTERGDPLPAYRELARVLEPWLFHEPRPMLNQSEADTRRWERRFLD